jgi:vacuolar-type H+-ATPase subunit H
LGKALIIEDFYLTIMLQLILGKRDNLVRREALNEKHIQQVLEIEKQAQELHDTAVKEAQQLPVLAEQEAQALIEKAKAEAQQQAREMVSQVKSDEESARILSEVEEKNKKFEAMAMSNSDRAVNYVLERVIGRA